MTRDKIIDEVLQNFKEGTPPNADSIIRTECSSIYEATKMIDIFKEIKWQELKPETLLNNQSIN